MANRNYFFDTAMLYGLNDEERKMLNDLFSKHHKLDAVILYGSRAKGNFRPNSDVDICLVGTQLTKSDMNAIDNEIDDLLLPYFFDISIFHHITNTDLLDHIHRVGIQLYSK